MNFKFWQKPKPIHVSLESYPTSLPTIQTISDALSILSPAQNDHSFYEKVYKTDGDVYSAINKLGVMVAESYEGFVGKHADEAEKIARMMNIEYYFKQGAIQLAIHGNYVAYKENNLKLRSLPQPYLTAIEKEDQIGNPLKQVFNANIYILNEYTGQHQQNMILGWQMKKYKKKDILHVKLDDSVVITDNLGRLTLGVWGLSPLEALRTHILWKWQTILNDVLWRSRNVPREHHKLDLSAFDPNNYPGTISEKYSAAQSDAENFIASYGEKLRKYGSRPDQSYITGKEVEIDYIEPRTSYLDPNELIMQLNNSIMSALGLHESMVSGRSTKSYAAEVILKGYTAVTITNLSKLLAKGFTELIKEKLMADGIPYEELSDLKMRIELTLDIDKMERIRRAAVMAGVGAFTLNEVRIAAGYPPLPNGDEIISTKGTTRGRVTGERTAADVVTDVVRRGTSKVRYPNKSDEKQGVR